VSNFTTSYYTGYLDVKTLSMEDLRVTTRPTAERDAVDANLEIWARELPELDLETALGERVSLSQARGRAGFDLLELEERPDRVYLGPRGTVWFLYGRPDAVRLLVAQTPRLRVDEPFILKKLAGAGASVETTRVRDNRAYFVSGEPHELILVDEHGIPVQETARLAQDVLLWEEDGRTYRLEGDLALDEALDIANSLR